MLFVENGRLITYRN